MKLSKEVGSKQKIFWPIICKFFLKKEKRFLSRVQKKCENTNPLIQCRLNVRMVNEAFDQYDDLLKLILDTITSITINLKILIR